MQTATSVSEHPNEKTHEPHDRAMYALPVALVVGFDLLGRAVAISSVLFAGALAAGQETGLALILFASFVGVLAIRVVRSLPSSILLTSQQTPIAAILPAVAAVGATGNPESNLVATALVVIGLASVLTGVLLLSLAKFDLGRLVRFLPYPVSTGFLAATGALLCFFAIKSSFGKGLDMSVIGLIPLAFTLAMAGVCTIAHRLAGETGVAAGLLGVLALFHVVMAAMGIDLATAQGWGLLKATTHAEGGLTFLPAVLTQVDMAAVVAAMPYILVTVLIAIIANYLNINAIEVAINVNLSEPKAGRMTGIATLISGGLGGPVVTSSPSSCISAHMMHGNHPMMPIILAAFLLLGVFLAQDITGIVPGFLSGGLLFFLGWRILWQWLVLPARQMPIFETLLSWLIVAVSLVWGMLPAVSLGGVIAVILFAITYSKLPVIRPKGGLAQWRSNVDRSGPESAMLDGQADRVALLQAEGFLFFGSVDQLTQALSVALAPHAVPRCVILDCGRVSGADATACSAIVRIASRAAKWRHRIFVAGGPHSLQSGLQRQMAMVKGDVHLSLFPDLDQALERAEDELIAVASGPAPDALATLRHLAGDMAPQIMAQMERMQLAEGDKLITAGAFSRDVFVLDHGRLGVYIKAPSGAPLRLRIVRAGAIVGEMASYLKGQRTADVVAEEPCQILVMRAETLESLIHTVPDTVAAWHRVMAQALAEKLMRTTRALAEQK